MGGKYFYEHTMMAQSLIAVLVLVALYLVWSQRRDRLLGGLPAGDLIAADNSEQECPVLLSTRHGLRANRTLWSWRGWRVYWLGGWDNSTCSSW